MQPELRSALTFKLATKVNEMGKDEQNNQLNLTVVALVALVAIVGLVALVMSASSAKTLATGSKLASADPLTDVGAAEAAASQNVVGSARYSCRVLNYIINNEEASATVKAWAGGNLGDCN